MQPAAAVSGRQTIEIRIAAIFLPHFKMETSQLLSACIISVEIFTTLIDLFSDPTSINVSLESSFANRMNCLAPKRGSNEYDSVEPSAPPYYPPQLAYNPHFIEPRTINVSDNLEFIYGWGVDHTNIEVPGRGFERALFRQRSFYEGVNDNYVPVSALLFGVHIADVFNQ